MILTVLGSSGPYPRPGGACNGFLLQEGETNLVIDMGNGAMSNLVKEVDFTNLATIIITHMHIDHFGDLYPLFEALRFYPGQPWNLPVLIPGGGLQQMVCIIGENAREYLPRVFAEQPIEKGKSYQVGGMNITFFPTRHTVEGYSVRIEVGDSILAYSSDTAPSLGLIEAARDADLFICEASFLASYEKEAAFGHMTSVQAAEAANSAGAKSLLLTHIWPTFDPEDILKEAREVYKGEASLAHEGLQLRLGGK